jgi:hypothetical protein
LCRPFLLAWFRWDPVPRRRFALANMPVVGSGAKISPAEACFDANFCEGLIPPGPPRKESTFMVGFLRG